MNKRFWIFLLAMLTGLVLVSVACAEGNDNVIYEADSIVVMLDNPNSPDEAVSATAKTVANEMSYESVWLNGPSGGSFPIHTNNTGTFGITIKVESSSSDSWTYCTVIDPSGNPCKGCNGLYIDRDTNGGDGWYGHVYNASSGTYQISYQAYTTVGMRIMCWIY